MSNPEESTNQIADNDPLSDLFLFIPLEVDEDTLSQLGPSQSSDDETGQVAPRSVIAEHFQRDAGLQAELKRPLYIGTYNNQPACLLVFKFTFQRCGVSSSYRIKSSKIRLEFKDAPLDPRRVKRRPGMTLNPVVHKFEPSLFEGPVHTSVVHNTISLSARVAFQGVPEVKAGICTTTMTPKEGQLSIQGNSYGLDGRQNQIVWTILEDNVLKNGIPGVLEFAVFVGYIEGRRFSVSVRVSAELGWNFFRSLKPTPVLGRNSDPVLFNPEHLRRLSKGEGKVIVEDKGALDELNLSFSLDGEGKVIVKDKEALDELDLPCSLDQNLENCS
ncbi:hypothetical protein K440DRAFT_661606 [Wilcoxina mikolae CBS 423.85]|nr:hypothetical protein K440DRAFT_661606 [Wilcoxina mikolae CBS 423.85]